MKKKSVRGGCTTREGLTMNINDIYRDMNEFFFLEYELNFSWIWMIVSSLESKRYPRYYLGVEVDILLLLNRCAESFRSNVKGKVRAWFPGWIVSWIWMIFPWISMIFPMNMSDFTLNMNESNLNMNDFPVIKNLVFGLNIATYMLPYPFRIFHGITFCGYLREI